MGDRRSCMITMKPQVWKGLQRTSIGAVRVGNRGLVLEMMVSGRNGLLEKVTLRLRLQVWVDQVVLGEGCMFRGRSLLCLRNEGKSRWDAAGSEWGGEQRRRGWDDEAKPTEALWYLLRILKFIIKGINARILSKGMMEIRLSNPFPQNSACFVKMD